MHSVGPAARAYRNGGLALGSAVFTKIPLDAVDAGDDAAGFFDVITHGRYNVPNAGSYRAEWVATPVASASGQTAIAALYRGNSGGSASIESIGSLAYSPAGLALLPSTGAIVVTCVANDWLELWCFSNPSLSLEVGKPYNCLSVQEVA